MGAIWVDPFASLVRRLAQKHGIKCFIETGTYMGDSARFAATVFPRVVTIEISSEFQQQAIARSRGRNIEFLLGDSASILPSVVSSLEGTALFWLDGHAGAGFYGEGDDNCPLAAELDAISASPHPHAIFIDDARAFLAPPPPPFQFERWPTLREVLNKACCRFPYYCVVISDSIMCVPNEMRMDIVQFCNTIRPEI
jgi:hypothetical protein